MTYDRATIDDALSQLRGLPGEYGVSLATLVRHRGATVAEQYAPTMSPSTQLISWSMAKTVVQALLGICVHKGLLSLDQPAPVEAWQHDERATITIRQLVHMSSGLRFAEEYVDASSSDVIEMLFGSGQDDVAGFAAGFPLDHTPGTRWSYSSGTSNILARIIGDAVGGGRADFDQFLNDELFGPCGIVGADARFDHAGTFIGSSFVYASADQFARFGQLYVDDGRAAGRQVLPPGWMHWTRAPAPVDMPADERYGYGAHVWLWERRGLPGVFGAHGYETQRIVMWPERELVVVQLSKVPADHVLRVDEQLVRIVGAFT